MSNPPNDPKSREDLHTAARTGDLLTVQSICASNPLAINSRDKHSRTPLHLAAWSGQTEVVRYLCQHKAEVGAAAMDDMGAIHFASQKGHLEIVRILLTSGASVKAANRKGLTPLHYAIQGSHLELVKYLVRKGASLSAKTKAGKSPLDLANNEEVRSILVDCEESSKKQKGPKERAEAGDSSPRQTDSNSNVNSASEFVAQKGEEEGDEQKKRKDEDDRIRGSSPEPKKTKVTLNHLLAGNDIEEENEEE